MAGIQKGPSTNLDGSNDLIFSFLFTNFQARIHNCDILFQFWDGIFVDLAWLDLLIHSMNMHWGSFWAYSFHILCFAVKRNLACEALA